MSLFGGGGDDSGPPTRKTHITRIYKNDDPDTGIWVDVERIDELTYTSGTGFQQQTKIWTVRLEQFRSGRRRCIQEENSGSERQ